MAKPNFPDAESRRICWAARDGFFDCLTTNNDEESKCQELKKAFESSCSKTWVKHFRRRRDFLKYRDTVTTQGFVPTTEEKEKS